MADIPIHAAHFRRSGSGIAAVDRVLHIDTSRGEHHARHWNGQRLQAARPPEVPTAKSSDQDGEAQRLSPSEGDEH